ncbi:Cytoplasmic dynein 2 light intermediate chain 1 [Trebouxia sp. C0010 RCD-2024]
MAVAGSFSSIWSQLTEQNKVDIAQTGNRPDANLYFVGPRGSGKSTMLNKYIQPDRADTPKPTDGLEYTYIRKPASSTSDRKELAHLWEVSGASDLPQEIFGISNILAPEQVATAVIAVVVDLSQPAEALKSAVAWFHLVRTKLQGVYDWLEQNGSKLPEQLQLRARKYISSSHEDKDSIHHLGISMVLVAAKEDTFRDADSEARQLMAQSLRYVAHLYGASLVYIGGLKASTAGIQSSSSSRKDTAADKAALANFRSMLSHMLFIGMDKRMKLRMEPQVDPLRLLMIPFGVDRFTDIGSPSGMASRDIGSQAVLDSWLAAAARMFPSPMQPVKTPHALDQEVYVEPGIDAVQQELEAKWKARQPVKSPTKAVTSSAVSNASLTGLQQARR